MGGYAPSMAGGGKTRKTLGSRIGDAIAEAMVRLGLPPKATHLVTVVGRRTGRPRTTPVSVVIDGDRRWLVAQFGETDWVRNARAAGRVTLTRGRRRGEYSVTELATAERVPVLRAYLRIEPMGRRRIGLGPDASDEQLLEVAGRHPVFRADPRPPDRVSRDR
jgi:deazaflavin-dependent oxidoreductase (nitroreductase family)